MFLVLKSIRILFTQTYMIILHMFQKKMRIEAHMRNRLEIRILRKKSKKLPE